MADETRRCGLCDFYDVPYCRFFPPVPAYNATALMPNQYIMTRWPQVEPNEWCGHFQPKKIAGTLPAIEG